MSDLKDVTVCFPLNNGQVLLGLKKRGFGVGRWNGFGGKVLPAENAEQAALRELEEETGYESGELKDVVLKKVGEIKYTFRDKPDLKLLMHIYLIDDFNFDAKETEEMKPQLFDFNNLPLDEMWSGDKDWLPLILKGEKIFAEYQFDTPENNLIIKKEFSPVSDS